MIYLYLLAIAFHLLFLFTCLREEELKREEILVDAFLEDVNLELVRKRYGLDQTIIIK